MSNEKDRATLQRMSERIARTVAYCQGTSFDAFEHNTMLQEACVFNILQIGELAKHGLSSVFVDAHPEMPWKQLYGLRNRIVHGYEGVRLNIVWDAINEDFPALLEQLRVLLAQ